MKGPETAHRGIASWAIRRPIGTAMIVSTVLIMGTVFIGRLPVDLLPIIQYPTVRVQVSNPGVEPAVLEETIAKPIESALAVTNGLTLMQTDISEGNVGVTLSFTLGTNVDLALQDAAKNLERVRARLPEEADPPTVNKFDPSQQPIYSVGFSSDVRDRISLRQWVDQRLRPQLLSVPGVAAVDISGGLVREIQVEVDQERLRTYGLSLSQVITALRNQNQDVAAGRLTSDTREVVGKTAGKFRSVDDIRDVLLSNSAGNRVALTQVATVRDTSAEERSWARLNGSPAVRISIRKQPDANTVEVVDGVAKAISRLATSGFIPPDIKHAVTFDQSTFIRDALKSVRDAAYLGALLAALVVLVFLKSLRKTFIIGVTIPLSILATFIAMGFGGLTLNIMSLGGLALGVGILLDNGIVMIENIYRRRESENLDPETAAHAGAAEITSAVVASTTTNTASVVPFLLITGLSALLFRELILTITFAHLASLPLALTLVPMLAAKMGQMKFQSGLARFRPLLAFERFIDRLRDGYRRVATVTVRHRGLVMGGALVMLIVGFLGLRRLPSTFLPQVDDGSVSVGFRFPSGTPPAQANRAAMELEQMVRKMPYVTSVFASAGGGGRGNLDILLTPASHRPMTGEEWTREMQRRIDARGFPGARLYVRPPRIRGIRTNQAGADISLAIQGDELPELERLAREVERRAEGVPGLDNLELQAQEAAPQLAIYMDRERLRSVGLDATTVGQTVRTALDGTVATKYTEGNMEFDVRVRLPRRQFTSAEDLAGVAMFPGSRGGPPIYLRDVADVREIVGPNEIRRENQNRLLRLNGDVLTEVAPISDVTDSVKARLAGMEWPNGYGIIVGGEQEQINETNRQMVLIIALAIFLVFVVMAVQYESVVDPLVILVTIPLALVGVVGTLWVTHTPLSAPVYLGMILLAGIVVNNGILLVEFMGALTRERRVSVEEAVVQAGYIRMRPVLMTALASMVGSLPLALGLGEGGELMRPLAIAVVGGIACSTVLTLFVVPCAYLSLHAVADRIQGFFFSDRSRGDVVETAGD